ncbi:MAG: UvrD-helicase domain-containing protein [Spirochaetaceae bacterium]|jgi:ATP-dependent helicase/nuclease subunit A|nr:UvrD-helicase domain-containing protein [Spirochaetaceae bacterium]
MAINDILAALNSEQRAAARAGQNAVVAAGAGSGKTRVLAARYAWLVMEQGYKPEQILALTFTNKAANEMHSRIYALLSKEKDNQNAREAVEHFYKARISTIDSFCASVARLASRHYGISPDFTSDSSAARDMAMNSALPFVLDHRDNPALQILIADRKIKTVAGELFAETMLRYSPITRPLDFAAFFKKQKEELLLQWTKANSDISLLLDDIACDIENAKKETRFSSECAEALKKIPEVPGIAALLTTPESPDNPQAEAPERERLCAYINALYNLGQTNLRGASGGFPVAAGRVKELRESLCPLLQNLANYVLQADIVASVFPLMDEFQEQHNRQKRAAGILSFSDIACMAVDALKEYPELRKIYKDEIRAVMIDEFQDNNRLQRDLIFLLAEKPDRNLRGIPEGDDLCPDKMFFVGDEKQSIYRFRGADVSVFRGLTKKIPAPKEESSFFLRYNYRSSAALIDAFNLVFGGISPGATLPSGPAVFLPGEAADFESYYLPAEAPSAAETRQAALHFYFLDEGRIDTEDAASLAPADLEAACIARTIRNMIDSGGLVSIRNGERVESRPCRWEDFAILQRSRGHQHRLEKHFQDFNIPFSADQPAGLFSDAPINDMRNYLRLLVYPEDRLSYAALLRSPFMRLSDEVLAAVLLSDSAVPFDDKIEEKIPPGELEQYRECGRRYRELAKKARVLPVNELVSLLWYEEGYRYETLWSSPAQVYGELFDFFYALACNSDRQGKTLVEFIDYIEELIDKEEKPDDLSSATEQGGGVRILTVHKSKGLEFPVVFLYRCAFNARRERNSGALCFSQTWGTCINLPQAGGLPPGSSGNIFFQLQKEEEAKKESAELRRLLYVAMTRAESALYLTASLPAQTKAEREAEGDLDNEAYDEELIRTRLKSLAVKRADKKDNFFDLLLPVLVSSNAAESGLFTVNTIPIQTRQELSAETGSPLYSMAPAAERAAPLYESSPVAAVLTRFHGHIPASKLSVPGSFAKTDNAKTGHAAQDQAEPDQAKTGKAKTGRAEADRTKTGHVYPELDRVLKSANIDAAKFGTVVHAFLEARFNGTAPSIPPAIASRLSEKELDVVQAASVRMTDGFLDSHLGSLVRKSLFREVEFPFLTRVKDRPFIIEGKIDMLFESEGTIHVVDFKTDREVEPAVHFAQIAVYARAVSDIYGKPVRSWLFYLRHEDSVELTEDVKGINIEALAEAYIERRDTAAKA